MRRFVLALLAWGTSTAWAAPVQVVATGRALDASGDPLEGAQELRFTLWNHPTGGASVWADTLTVTCADGFFAATLGAEAALDDTVFDASALYLGLTIGQGTELPGRQRIAPLPYAVHARSATSAEGGPVDATAIAVDGVTVFDGPTFVGDVGRATLGDLTCAASEIPRFDGSAWGCGPATSPVGWADVTGVPAALVDGDTDTFASLPCGEGQQPYRAAGFSTWGCIDTVTAQGAEDALTAGPVDLKAGTTRNGAAIATGPHTVDTRLTEAQVEGYVTNGAIGLAGGTTLGGVALSTGPHTVDTKLTRAEVRAFVADDSIDLAPGSRVGGARLSTGPHTVDTVLTEAEVEAYVTNGPLVLDPGTSVEGNVIAQGIPLVADYAYAQTAEPIAASTPIPWDDTVPTATEGTEILAVTLAPKQTGNLLIFEGTVNWVEPANTSDYFTVALTEGAGPAVAATTDGSSNGNARCSESGFTQICTMPFQFVRVAASAASTTWHLRVGLNSGTAYVNQSISGRRLGGTLYSTLSVTEVRQ